MALVDIENPVAIRDVRLLGLFQVWHSKLTGQRLPTSGDMDPKGLARWADNLMLIDVPGDVLSFRIRSGRASKRCSSCRAPVLGSKP